VKDAGGVEEKSEARTNRGRRHGPLPEAEFPQSAEADSMSTSEKCDVLEIVDMGIASDRWRGDCWPEKVVRPAGGGEWR
jgi:hypothetical protein